MSNFGARLSLSRWLFVIALALTVLAHFFPWERTPDLTKSRHYFGPRFVSRYPPLMEILWPESMLENGTEEVHEFPTSHVWESVWNSRPCYAPWSNNWNWNNASFRNDLAMAVCCVVTALWLIAAPFLASLLTKVAPLVWISRFMLLTLCGWFAFTFSREHLHPNSDPPSQPALGYWLVVSGVWVHLIGLFMVPNAKNVASSAGDGQRN